MSHSHDDGVSSVVGTILMLAITVSVFGGFAVFALGYVSEKDDKVRSDLTVVSSTNSLLFAHKGGESLSAGGTIYVNVAGYERAIPLTDAGLAAHASQYGLTPRTLASLGLDNGWTVGDVVCIRGNGACIYPATEDVRGAFYVTANTLLLQQGDRGLQGIPRPDLVVTLQAQAPPTAYAGNSVVFTARVSNTAGIATSLAPSVRFQVDGTTLGTVAAAGTIAVGAHRDVTGPAWTATAGTHTLVLAVDPGNAIAEGDEGNNQISIPFNVGTGNPNPPHPFVDTNGDGLFTPGTDTAIPAADVTDGVYNAGGQGLVIPASVGPITASTITYTAGGDITVAVDLTATTNPLTLNAGGDIILDANTLSALNNNNDMNLNAGGSIQGAGVSMSVDGHLTVTANGPVDFSGGNIAVTFANRDLAITGASVDLDGATLASARDITVTASNGALSAVGLVLDAPGTARLRVANGGGIDVSGADLAAGTLQACLPTATTPTHKLTLSAATLLDDANDRIAVRIAGTACTQSAGTYTNYVDAYATHAARVES